MRLSQLVQNREEGKTVTAGHWYSYCWRDGNGDLVVNINHYWTMMLQFSPRDTKPHGAIPVQYVQHVDLGHGSRSDQDGMNKLFRELGLPWYYSRKNGCAQVIDLIETPTHSALPKYLRDPIVRRKVYGYVS